jgi:group I intron endonuclease
MQNNLNGSFTLVIIYDNADTNKVMILKDNKGKARIYQWTHKESGKIYIGSAVDLSKRLRTYYSKSHLNRYKTMHINNALLLHGHSSFSLTILEIISISNLTKEEARKLILEREQLYLDSFSPEYNILPTAGSRLGSFHTLEVIAKMSGENNHFFGKVHSEITLEKLSEIKKGQNNPMFGKKHLPETVRKIMKLIQVKITQCLVNNIE